MKSIFCSQSAMDSKLIESLQQKRIDERAEELTTKFLLHQKLLYFGHVKRHDEILQKTILEGTIEGRARKEGCEKDGHTISCTDCESIGLAKDRIIFRAAVLQLQQSDQAMLLMDDEFVKENVTR